MSERPVRIPRSARRRRVLTYAKLILHVRPHPVTGFDFQGVLLAPGSRIQKTDLWPQPDSPRIPLLLEYAGADDPGWGHHRTPGTYILWIWEEDAWRELARTTAHSWEWCIVLGPVAERVIQEGCASGSSPEPHWAKADRIMAVVERSISLTPPADQLHLMCLIHDRLAAKQSALLHSKDAREDTVDLSGKGVLEDRAKVFSRTPSAASIIIDQKEEERKQQQTAGMANCHASQARKKAGRSRSVKVLDKSKKIA